MLQSILRHRKASVHFVGIKNYRIYSFIKNVVLFHLISNNLRQAAMQRAALYCVEGTSRDTAGVTYGGKGEEQSLWLDSPAGSDSHRLRRKILKTSQQDQRSQTRHLSLSSRGLTPFFHFNHQYIDIKLILNPWYNLNETIAIFPGKNGHLCKGPLFNVSFLLKMQIINFLVQVPYLTFDLVI